MSDSYSDGSLEVSSGDVEIDLSSQDGKEVRKSQIPMCTTPVTLRFNNVSYAVMEDSKKKDILRGVSGVVEPGEVLAILGPSGAGKTTLLNILLGRLEADDKESFLDGDVTASGLPVGKLDKRKIGYVMQEDYLFSELTVRETLNFAALLRLSRTMTNSEKLARVDAIIAAFNLDSCSDTKIGNQFIRGVSGGEKKRVNIATEMLFDPSILMLDEPTSGLDSSTALTIINELKLLASTNRTIVTTIHQPSSQIFYNFDKVCLMREGEIVFFGKASTVVDYFNKIELPPPSNYNPADYMLEIVSHTKEGPTLRQRFLESGLEDQDTESSELIEEYDVQPRRGLCTSKWEASFWMQLWLLTERSFKQMRGDKFTWVFSCQYGALTIISSLIWFQMDKTDQTLQDRLGVAFFAILFWTFDPLFHTLMLFPAERSILKKERASGAYRISAYFLSKCLAEIPIQLFYPTCYTVVVYWAVGYEARVDKFCIHVIVVILQVLCAQSVGLIFGAAVMDLKKAIAMAGTIVLAMMLLGGYYVNNQNLPSWMSVVKYISIVKYAYEALVLNEVAGVEYPCVDAANSQFKTCPVDEAAIREHYVIEGELWHKIVITIGITIGMRVISYLFLRFNKKTK